MSKRRMFDIDFPSEPTPEAAPETKSAPREPAPEPRPAAAGQRRGPMATAITENAEALRQRAAAEQTIRAENDRLAHEFVRLKKLGLVVDRIPLDEIRTSKLTRDRAGDVDPELDELKESIRTIGLSNPIRVEEAEDGAYELVQGFRRWSAFKALRDETGSEEFATIPAGLVAKGETLTGLYRRMVDENLVRKDISFAEIAQLAQSFANDPDTEVSDLDQAIAMLFASAGRQKRIYIRNFAELLEELSGALKYPEALPRALGLELRKAVQGDAAFGPGLRRALEASPAETAEDELLLLRYHLKVHKTEQPASGAEDLQVGRAAGKTASVAKTTLRFDVPAGTVRCQARAGKIEMAVDKDFSEIERPRLEAAIQAFFKALED